MTIDEIAARIMTVGPHVRYVAILEGDNLHLVTQDGLADASSPESDRFEELLVNPTLLTMAQRRGTIDCGGLDFLVVGYGNFRQIVVPTQRGHVSVALEIDAVAIGGLDEILKIIGSVLG